MFGLVDRETFSTEYVIADIATGLLLLENRLAYAQSQLTSSKFSEFFLGGGGACSIADIATGSAIVRKY